MFAARFDPNQIVTNSNSNTTNEKSKIIPLKRKVEDTSDIEETSDLEEESEQESEVESEHTEITKEEGKQDEIDNDTPQSEAITLENDKKFDSVFSRFKKTLSIQNKLPDVNKESDDEVLDKEHIHDLTQIPQPDIVRPNKDSNGNLISNDTTASKSTAWLNAKKIYYDNSMIKNFDSYNDELNSKIIQNIKDTYSKETFPIQTILLDTLLSKLNFSTSINKKNFTKRIGDILVNASTGSGKTLGYSIPIIQTLSNRKVNKLRALIVVPTKLLINQVYDTLVKLSKGTSLVISISKLDISVKEEHAKFLNQEPDILITTPGRLVDHLQSNSITLKNLKFLVLDEADRLLNQSFQNWCSELMKRLKTDKQNQLPGNVIKLVFSATLTTNTEKLNNLQFYKPQLFLMDSVKLYNLPTTLQEFNILIPTAKSVYKPLFLLRLLSNHINTKSSKILVFVKSNEGSLRLASLLKIMLDTNSLFDKSVENTLEISSINSNNSRSENRKLVNNFTSENDNSKSKILITTDLISRGIDINNITHVINYDVPISSQQYVHRCGRTARARSDGEVLNFLVGKGERTFWNKTINEDISRDVEGHAPELWGQDSTTTEDTEYIEITDVDSEKQEILQQFLTVSSDKQSAYKESLSVLKERALAN